MHSSRSLKWNFRLFEFFNRDPIFYTTTYRFFLPRLLCNEKIITVCGCQIVPVVLVQMHPIIKEPEKGREYFSSGFYPWFYAKFFFFSWSRRKWGASVLTENRNHRYKAVLCRYWVCSERKPSVEKYTPLNIIKNSIKYKRRFRLFWFLNNSLEWYMQFCR